MHDPLDLIDTLDFPQRGNYFLQVLNIHDIQRDVDGCLVVPRARFDVLNVAMHAADHRSDIGQQALSVRGEES